MIKYLSATLVLALAIVLQLWFTPAGIRGDFVLAMLIIFSFLFEFPELLVFVLLAVLVIDPFPWFNLEVVLFVLIPFATYGLRRWFALEAWIGGAVSIALGIFLFYLIIAPSEMFSAFGFLLLDIAACVAFGELMLSGMVE